MKNVLCPICGKPLATGDKVLFCENRHSFDRAKEGYVNLLPVNKKKKKDPGDNLEMVLAREAFLEKGYFAELAETVAEKMAAHGVASSSEVLDIGCGTGYYSRILKEKTGCSVNGIDISKHAVKIAAKKDDTGRYFVASAFALPFERESFDGTMNIFAPKAGEEYARVLKTNGVLVEVVPGRDHLIELKQVLYSEVRKNEEKAPIGGGLALKEESRVIYRKNVEKDEDIFHLLKMTPYWYKTQKTALERFTGVTNKEVTFDFVVRVWQKTGETPCA